eukprot:gb/GECG01003646.1/.p1 GENE.gb/GECG01003646.1/~~gb/GECG01003646.1/.p1  ORF type:complete len:1723 (+),score=251.44 gb/GECG01003646.1/:1-5169(+)
MASSMAPPINVRSVINLPSLGVKADDISFKTLSLASDKAVCLRETSDPKQVSILDLSSGQFVHRVQAGTDGAALTPNTRTLAVRVGGALQLQNMESNKKLKGTKMPADDPVVFMKWVNDSILGIVTENSVYHWSVDGSGSPEKMFDRHNNLSDCKMIIDYSASSDLKWLMLVGLAVKDGTPEGRMQLYSVERKVSQPLPAFAGCFTQLKPPGRSDNANLFCFVQRKPGENLKLQVIEVGRGKDSPGEAFRVGPVDLPVPSDAAGDFPVTLHCSRKNDLIYVLSKSGYVYVFDMHTGGAVARERVSSDSPIFTSAVHEASGGVLAVTTKTGRVQLITIDEKNIVSYVSNKLNNTDLAMQLAGRLGAQGADELFVKQFNDKIAAGDIDGAARVAAESPGTTLRNKETINKIQNMPAQQGQQKPVAKYFSVLMQHGRLNAIETAELARVVLAQGRAELLQKWMREDKITPSEELGDLVQRFDPNLALEMYQSSGQSHEKVINCYMAAGDYDKIIPYARRNGYNPNYEGILDNLIKTDPSAAQNFATQLVKAEGGSLIGIEQAMDKFRRSNRLRECTGFLLDVLDGDRRDQAQLQTKLLEMNLSGGDPQTADYILGSDNFHHFDRPHIAKLCERAGLFQRALELYEDLNDIKRCLRNTARLSQDFLVKYFGNLSAEDAIDCLKELMQTRSNEPLVIKISQEYAEQLGEDALIDIFVQHESWNGLFYFLGAIVNNSENPNVHFRYIQAAAKCKQLKEVERVCRDSKVYDPEEVKNFLMEIQLPDPRPFIHVCDKHGYLDEMTTYLYNNNLKRFIEVYVSKVSPQKAPAVIGRLLDLDADEDFVKKCLELCRNECPVSDLVIEVEKRNRLRLLQPWLESKVSEGNTDASTHNALGKIYVTLNKEPQQFLTTNQFYDSRELGAYCEKLDPYLAFLAYKRAGGDCDEELLDVTNKNGLFKDQARYLVEKQDMELWARVLNDDNPYRKQLIDQVVSTALPETDDADSVSVTVKAFMQAKLPSELIGLLEKLVIHGDVFSNYTNLQNLLIITAIKCSNMQDAPQDRVMDYIHRLDNFDGSSIAEIALRENYQLYEEAFAIYKKFSEHEKAVDVLIDHIENLDRAHEYAERVDTKHVWAKLAKAQLDAGMVKDSVSSYIKADDATNYKEVIDVAKNEGDYENLAKYLEMARKKKKEKTIDSALVYAYSQTNRLGDLETFITSPNVADIQEVGDQCFEEGLYKAAKSLFANAHNNAKLASTLVRLGEYQEAVDAAIKANSMRSMCDVNAACVEAREFRLAQKVALRVINSPDYLDEIVAHYEKGGHFDEVIEVLEMGSSSDQAHQGVFTQLGVLYSRYRPEKLMEHIKLFWSRINVSRLMRACEEGRHWDEAAFLQIQAEEYDTAVQIMMEHSPVAFNHDQFVDIISRVRNNELLYRAVQFYLEEEPMRLEKLLQILKKKLDHARVVHLVRKSGHDNLALILSYLKSIQDQNISAVNEAVNQIMIDDEDYHGLRESIENHDNFDHLDLAKFLEKHELLEFRRIAAALYRQNKRYEHSINLSKSDNMYKDAIETAAASEDSALCDDLIRFFMEQKDKESFAATLYTCYNLVSPDVALELGWRNRVLDYVMPYMVQYLKDANGRLNELYNQKKKSEKSATEDTSSMDAHAYMMNPDVHMLANEAYNPNMHPHHANPYAPPVPPYGQAYGAPPQQPGYGYGAPQDADVYTMHGAVPY